MPLPLLPSALLHSGISGLAVEGTVFVDHIQAQSIHDPSDTSRSVRHCIRSPNIDPFFYHRLLSKEGFCSTHSAHQTKFSSGTISTGSSGETVNVGIRAIQLEHTRDLVFAGPISSLSTVPRQGQGAGTKSKTFGVCASDICTKY